MVIYVLFFLFHSVKVCFFLGKGHFVKVVYVEVWEIFSFEVFLFSCYLKATRALKKLKAHSIAGYLDALKPFGDSNLNGK